jgi:phosphoribosylformylglycinamidine (FGAM) synthase-like amidotransferase family enzyme
MNTKIQKCLDIAKAEGLVNIKFVEVGEDESLMDVAARYAKQHGLGTGNWIDHNTNGLVEFQTINIINSDGNIVETLAHINHSV